MAQNEEDELSVADQMKSWEQDERKKMQEEHERPVGSNHVEDGGDDAQRLAQ
jgi:hypothetical protein